MARRRVPPPSIDDDDEFPDELRNSMPRPPEGVRWWIEQDFHERYWPLVLEHRRGREEWFTARGLHTREQQNAAEFPPR